MPYLQSVQAGHLCRRNFQRPPWDHPRFPMSSTKPCLPPWGLFSRGQPCRSHTTAERLYQFTRAAVVLRNKHPQTLSAYDSNICITHEVVGWLTRISSAGSCSSLPHKSLFFSWDQQADPGMFFSQKMAGTQESKPRNTSAFQVPEHLACKHTYHQQK